MGLSASDIGAIVGSIVGFFVLLFLMIPLTGLGPAWSHRAWTRIIRCFKRGDIRPWTWSTIEEGVLYVSSLPRTKEDLEEMRAPPHNVGAVVSLNEPWELVLTPADLASLNMEWKHLVVPDYSAPKLETIIEAVKWIHSKAREGKGVLVHCNAGRGRSVVVALGYLIVLHKGWGSVEAFEHVAARREVANLRAMWDTRPQWRSLRRFEKWLTKLGGVSVFLEAQEAAVPQKPPVEGAAAYPPGRVSVVVQLPLEPGDTKAPAGGYHGVQQTPREGGAGQGGQVIDVSFDGASPEVVAFTPAVKGDAGGAAGRFLSGGGDGLGKRGGLGIMAKLDFEDAGMDLPGTPSRG